MNTNSTVLENYAWHNDGLEITFKGGRTYRYDCPADIFHRLTTSPSKGRFYNWFIKGQFPSSEIPLKRVVNLCFRAAGSPEPTIQFCNDVILIGKTPYGGGAESVMNYFLKRVERYL